MNRDGTVVKCCSSYKSLFGGRRELTIGEAASTKDSPGMTRSGTKFSLTNQDCTNDNEKKKIGDRLNKWNE